MMGCLLDFAGPVFAREALELSRRKRTYVLRTVYALLLLWMAHNVWSGSRYMAVRYQWCELQRAAYAASGLFTVVGWGQIVATYLILPALLSAAIAGEWERRTLVALAATPLTDRQIVLSKLFSRLAAGIMLLLTGLPIIAISALLGGIDLEAVLRAFAVTGLALLIGGSVGIYASAICTTPSAGLVVAYTILFAWLVGLPTIGALLFDFAVGTGWQAVDGLIRELYRMLNPTEHAMAALDTSEYVRRINLHGPWSFSASFVMPALIAVLFICRATAHVRRLRRLEPAGSACVSKLARWLWPNRRFGRRSPTPERLLRFLPISNPLWIRSRQAPVYDRQGYLRAFQSLGWLLTLGLFGLFAAANPSAFASESYAAIVWLQVWLVLWLTAAVTGAGSIAGDRERGFLDAVLATPLGARELVDGSILALLRNLRLALWLPPFAGFVFWLGGAMNIADWLVTVIAGSLVMLVIAFLGLVSSWATRNANQAIVLTLAVPLGLIGAGFLLVVVLEKRFLPCLWVALVPGLIIGWRSWRDRPGPASAVGLFLAVHVALVALTTMWNYDVRDQSMFCEASLFPIPWLSVVPGAPSKISGSPVTYYVAAGEYILALLLNLFWARRWLIRDFSRFSGRVEGKPESLTR